MGLRDRYVACSPCRGEHPHEGEPRGAATLARVEQDDRDVAGPAVEVAEERRGPEERVDRPGPPDQGERAVHELRVPVRVLADDPAAIGRDALGPLDERSELALQVVEPPLRRDRRGPPLHVDDPTHPLVTLGADAVEEELLQVDREHDPAVGDELRAQLPDFHAEIEFLLQARTGQSRTDSSASC